MGRSTLHTPDFNSDTYQFNQKLFLAGSIEQGKAYDWQEQVIKEFENYDISIFNPRRRKWNAELEQSFTNETFREQVVWEQNEMLQATHVLMYLVAGTMSPISQFEFGQLTMMPNIDTVIVCPKAFWRRGNYEVYSALFGIPRYETLEEGIAHLKTILKK